MFFKYFILCLLGFRIAFASLAEKKDTEQTLDQKSQTGHMNLNNSAGGVGGTVTVNVGSDMDNDNDDGASSNKPHTGNEDSGQMSQGLTVIFFFTIKKII